MSPQYLEQLDNERQTVFQQLKEFKKDFILAGGTAIMLQIGHRFSYDFDCFTEKELPQLLLKRIIKVFGREIKVEIENPEMFMIKTKKEIRIDFVVHPFIKLHTPIKTSSLDLLHLDDLAANKARVIGRRGQWRDYVDLFFLLKWRLYSLSKIIALAEKKFMAEFNIKLFLQQLVYYNDLDLLPIKYLKEPYKNSEIQAYLEQQVDQYVKKRLGTK